MALDLLYESGVPRLYRHDAESFAWVLLWICGHYDNGSMVDNPCEVFDGWNDSNMRIAHDAKGLHQGKPQVIIVHKVTQNMSIVYNCTKIYNYTRLS
jgi:hypothetical protein